MRRIALTSLWIFSLVLSGSMVIAQCTDSDADGYYYEEGCGTPRDCNDANASINPGATEMCNGFDDDCDGSLDEGCDNICDNPEKAGSDVRVSYDDASSKESSLVWTGNEYAVSWHDERNGNSEIYFARLDSSGNKIGLDVRVTNNSSYSGYPSLVWTGHEFGVSWHDYRNLQDEVYFARLDSVGNKIGEDIRVTYASGWSRFTSLVWTGSEYGISWFDLRYGGDNDEIYFARLDALGGKIGNDVRVTYDFASSQRPSLVWSGSGFGVSWEDGRDSLDEIYFARLDSAGNKIGEDVRITYSNGISYASSLSWTGNEYGISWYDVRDGNSEIYFMRLDSSGNKIGSDIRVTYTYSNSYFPSLVWTGSEFGISWHESAIYFARLDSAGNKIGEDVRINFSGGSSYSPSLAWTGNEFGISWDANSDASSEIYFAMLKCCHDVDMDNYNECYDCNDDDSSVYPNAIELCDSIDNDCDITVDEPPPSIKGNIFDKNKQTIKWNAEVQADRYDVVKGDLISLRSSKGDFTSSLTDCLEDNSLDTQASDTIDPSSGQGFYYLVRAQADCMSGTYNTEQPSQIGERDSEIESSSNKCP